MADTLEVISDLTADQLREMTEPTVITIASDDEMASIQRALDQDVLGDGDEPEAPPVRPAATAKEPPATPDKRKIGDKEYSAEDAWKFLEDQHKWNATNTQRAEENARILRENAARKAELDAAERRILEAINTRIPEPPPAPVIPSQIDLSVVGPMPDVTTLEGQEQMQVWLPKALAQVAATSAASARETVLRDVDGRLSGVPATTTATVDRVLTERESAALNARITGHNEALKNDVIGRASEFNLTPFQARAALDAIARGDVDVADIQPSGDMTPVGRLYTADDIVKAGHKLMNTQSTAAAAADTATAQTLQTIKRAQSASDVLRTGKAPAVQTLKASDVLAMSPQELRQRVVGPMKGRPGAAAHGIGPLMKTWKTAEELQG